MRKRKQYEFEITSTAFPGFGVAERDGDLAYIKNAIPGQKLIGRVHKMKKGIAYAKIVEILEDADYKIEPKCPHLPECGGCSHQFISYEKQLEFKRQQVVDLFEKAGITDFEFMGIESSPEEFEYRNKMEFTFGDFEKGGDLTLGMHMKGKNFGILTVDNCKLVDEDFRIILKEAVEYFKENKVPHYRNRSREGYLRNLVVRKAKNTGEIIINIVVTSQIDFDFTEIVEKLKNLPYKGTLKSILHTTNDSLSDVVKADKIEVLYGQDYITETLLGLNFKISPFSFFQTNSKGAEKLYSIVKDFMGDCKSKVVFDLYCGTGTIGQIVAPNAKKVLGIELIEEAVAAANENAKLNGLDNCKFIAGDVAEVIKTVTDKPDVIILDPPRPGVHPKALDYVIKFNAKDIVYVSCNPVSLVNDLKVLIERGYKVEKVVAMDMFPQTSHVETVVKLSK